MIIIKAANLQIRGPISLDYRPVARKNNKQAHCLFLTRAYSKVVLRYIRIVEAAVRFRLGPPDRTFAV